MSDSTLRYINPTEPNTVTTATYTRAQYEAQARVLRAQIGDEDRRIADLQNVPEDVRANHERMIRNRRAYFVKRLDGLRVHLGE